GGGARVGLRDPVPLAEAGAHLERPVALARARPLGRVVDEQRDVVAVEGPDQLAPQLPERLLLVAALEDPRDRGQELAEHVLADEVLAREEPRPAPGRPAVLRHAPPPRRILRDRPRAR